MPRSCCTGIRPCCRYHPTVRTRTECPLLQVTRRQRPTLLAQRRGCLHNPGLPLLLTLLSFISISSPINPFILSSWSLLALLLSNHHRCPWAVNRRNMCELPKHGAREEPSSTGISRHDHIQSDRSSTKISNDTSIDQIQDRTFVPSDEESKSSTGPPRSRQSASPRPIEYLANQLRNQSLKQPEGSVAVSGATTTFSHQSPSGDGMLRTLGNSNDTTMNLDVEDEDEPQKYFTVPRSRSRPARKKITSDHILDMISSEFQCTIRPSPSCSNHTVPDPNHPNPPTVFHSFADLHANPIEVDEGYVENQDDFSWLESVVSLRSSRSPSGVTKRFGLRFRSSADAACRDNNLVHSLPRMRRREKSSRAHSSSAGETSKGSSSK